MLQSVGWGACWKVCLGIFLVFGVMGCGEEDDSGPTCEDPRCLTPGPTTCGEYAGAWAGTWAAVGGILDGDATVDLEQEGCALDGFATFLGAPCISGAIVEATIAGRTITGSLTARTEGTRPSLVEVEFEGEATEEGDRVDLAFVVVTAEGGNAFICDGLEGEILLRR